MVFSSFHTTFGIDGHAIIALKGFTTLTEEQILKRYPTMIPLRGVDPNDGDPKNHVRVERPKDHERINPEHYRAMLAEKPTVALTVAQSVALALEKERAERKDDLDFAVSAERLRCAKIAEGIGGKYGVQISEKIRGMQAPPTEPSFLDPIEG